MARRFAGAGAAAELEAGAAGVAELEARSDLAAALASTQLTAELAAGPEL